MTSTATPDRRRAAYIDWTRGLAVLLMIEAHTVDSWTRLSSRGSTAWTYAVLLAGLAAPLFLWLAGLSIPLACAAGLRRGLSRRAAAEKVIRRGVEIFILAFVFRLQAFFLSPGAHPVTLFRVDILNIMGPAIAAAGVLWWLVDAATPVLVIVFALVATGISMATPIVRHLGMIGSLPAWVQWYIRPSGDNTTFTSFPWIGFVFAGAAVGALLSPGRETPAGGRRLLGIGIAGSAIVAGGYYASFLPSIYADSSFWTTSPAYFAIRCGIAMATAAVLFGVERIVRPERLRMLGHLGRSSLFVYWIHVELVYGYASWPLRRHLPLWGTAIAYTLFTLLMIGAVLLRDRVADKWDSMRRRREEQIAFQYKVETV